MKQLTSTCHVVVAKLSTARRPDVKDVSTGPQDFFKVIYALDYLFEELYRNFVHSRVFMAFSVTAMFMLILTLPLTLKKVFHHD